MDGSNNKDARLCSETNDCPTRRASNPGPVVCRSNHKAAKPGAKKILHEVSEPLRGQIGGWSTVGQDDFVFPPLAEIACAGAESIAQLLICLSHQAPELRPLMDTVCIRTEETLPGPFEIHDGVHIALNPRFLNNISATTVHLRHALEIALWQRSIEGEPSRVQRAAISLLACRVAALYDDSLPPGRRDLCHSYLPDRTAIDQLADKRLGRAPGEFFKKVQSSQLAQLLKPLLRLQGIDLTAQGSLSSQQQREFMDFFEQAVPIAAPLGYLLTTGGDTRLAVDTKTGLNRHGCSPRPRPWAVTFSSSTATSVSEHAFRQAEALRQRLIVAVCRGELETHFEAQLERVKSALLSLLGLDDLDGTEIILTGSGTDAELYALYLAFVEPTDKVVNIVVAPEETGSGVIYAAAGQHFATQTPFAETVLPGIPINGLPAMQIQLEQVGIRDDSAELLPLEEVDRQVKRLVEQAVHQGARVLLHYVQSSKTGISAPSIETVCNLHQAHHPFVDGVIDACQMRISRQNLKKFIEMGFMVLITGSKFFTGPPFSGALIVPRAIANRISADRLGPAGFAGYASRSEWPRQWRSVRAGLSDRLNYGLLLRWEAALWEMRAFYSVPGAQRDRILSDFRRTILEAIDRHPQLKLIGIRPREGHYSPHNTPWDALPTIFTFLVLRPSRDGLSQPLTMAEARKVYQWLNMDISAELPQEASATERATAARRCHIGQPVKVGSRGGESIGALRISAGARLVSGVAFDPRLGADMAKRLSREIGDALTVLEKITVLTKYMEHMEPAMSRPRHDRE